jgi:hypothetical protein
MPASVTLLEEQTDGAWRFIRSRLEGLTDEEFFWEPVRDVWTIRSKDGIWMMDEPEVPDDWPEFDTHQRPPFTTIGWRLVHVAACKVMYHDYGFGPATGRWSDLVPHAARDAISLLEHGHARLSEALSRLSDADLDEPRRTNWGDTWPTWRIFTTMIEHDFHHGAEIACVRDLYRHTVPR